MSTSLDFLFHPKSVAVLGASETPRSWGRFMMEHLESYGFEGSVYPVNPRQPEVLGAKAYSSLDDIPGTVDYVIYLIGIGNALDVLEQCARKGVKAVHMLAGRAAETGRPELINLEQKILNRAREYGIRMIGPNCLGIFCPSSGLSLAKPRSHSFATPSLVIRMLSGLMSR